MNDPRRNMSMNIRTIPSFTMITTLLSYLIMIIVGHAQDLVGKVFYPEEFEQMKRKNGMEPLVTDFESFYTRRLYGKISDCWNRPIHGVPGKIISVLERTSDDGNRTLKLSGNVIKAINIGSYNYLGLSSNSGQTADDVIETITKMPVNMPGVLRDIGTNRINALLEKEMAEFLHKEDCMVFPMGFGTNSCNIPILMDESCLILSDELNHTSLVYGSRMAEATVRKFSHNNMKDLEIQLRNNIAQGQPTTYKAWRKIFVVVEGLYSMEGTILKLKEIVELKKKYKFYLFVDEAHSIGALGKTGRGICEYTGVSFDDVDILMGTFTKSFGSSGGYIASSKDLINNLRYYSDFSLYGEQIAPGVAQQTLSCLRMINSAAGRELAGNLNRNTLYFREKLTDLGYILFGDKNSPVVPLMIFNPGKIAEFSRMCLERKLAVVVVGYPATPVISSRVRFCLSASFTLEDLDFMIEIIDYVGKSLGLNVIKAKNE